jgi:hypothetical protein
MVVFAGTKGFSAASTCDARPAKKTLSGPAKAGFTQQSAEGRPPK